MKLLTKKIIKDTPKLYSTENIALSEKQVTARFEFPMGAGTWYLMELDKTNNDLAFGLCIIFEKELGYFSIKEMEETKVKGFKIMRDKNFKPCKYKDLEDKK
tara:strand:- start:473 stop:778 length:306 start_codon:yes stop_codon:yes gene_type:complete